GVGESIRSLESRGGGQGVLLFLGDGKSVAGPIDGEDRSDLCAAMVKKQVGFFAVPLGLRPDPQNLHSLVTGTGGKVLRHSPAETAPVIAERVKKAMAEPILYPSEFKLPATVLESMPTRLPPLPRDSPTLVVGTLKAPAHTLSFKLAP